MRILAVIIDPGEVKKILRVVGVIRWGLRVSAHALLLVTDVYPPFSLK